jgi:hypothetical protein
MRNRTKCVRQRATGERKMELSEASKSILDLGTRNDGCVIVTRLKEFIILQSGTENVTEPNDTKTLAEIDEAIKQLILQGLIK